MANKKIQLTTNIDNQIVDVYPVTKSEFVEFSDGKTLDEKINTVSTEHKHDLATPAKDGFMSKEDKAKLDGVTNYTHPNTHAATMITEDNDHRFVTDAEKNKWNNKVDAVLATNASNGLMSASDKQKIDDLNNQFKNRDDKIEKNKEDIQSWNDEMIDKKYQYFNKENNTINDSIVSKTFDMVIQGKTIHNLVVNGNEKGIIDKKINDNTRLQNRTISYDLIPGKTYIGYINVIKYEGSFSNGGLRIYGNVAGSASKIAEKTGWTKFEWTIPDSVMSPITSISIYIESSDFNNGCIIEFDSLMLFEENSQIEDLTEYCNGIKSFGEQENNNIKIISNNENLIIPPEKTVSGGYASIDIKMNTDGTIIINGNSTGTGGRQAFFEKIPTIKIEKGKSYILSANCENLSGIFLNRISDNTAYVGTTTASYFVAEEDIEVYVGVNLKIMNYDNEVIYPMLIENKKTKPFIFNKSDKNNILLKEPLRSINEAYDKIWKNNKQVELIRRVCQYTFVGKEDWIFNAERGDFVRFLCKMDKKPANSGTKKIISNIFPSNGDVFDKPTIFAYTTHGIVIAIEKSKLSSPDVNGFKQWLTNNNLTVVYELAEQETEVLENCMDLNLNTFSNKTYITSNNNIKGKLSFSVPINTAANLENNSNRLNTVEDYIDINKNNKEKINKLEEGAVTTALNILEIKKNTSMLNNGEINEYSNHTGTFIECNNTLDSRTENMIVKGKTLVNLFNGKKVNIGSYSSFTCTYKDGVFDLNAKTVNVIISYPKMELEDNKKYTLICHVMENTLTPMTGTAFRLIRPESYGAEVFLPANFTRGVFKTTFTTNKNNASGWYDTHANLFVISATGRIKFSIMVFEGDIDYIPYHFEGIKSLGEQENNNINLVSYTDNLLYNIKKVFLSVENGKESISDIYFTSDFVYAPLSTYYKSLLDNEYVLTNVFYYGKDKEYLYQINIVEKDSFDNYPNAKYIRLVGRRADKGTNVNLDNVKIIVGSKKYTEYFESKIDQRTIQLKEPLCEDDFVYEDNKAIKVFKKSKSYTFTGDETNNGVFYNDNNTQLEKTHLFYVNDPMFKSKNNKVICNSLKTIEANQLAKLDEPYIFCRGDGVLYFNLYKKDLSTVNTTGFKQWIKNNPTTVISYLDNPVIKELSCIDTNVDTYKDTTYVTTDNSIKGELEFKTQNNFGAIMKNVNRCISKIFNSLNNILNIKGE